MEQERALFDDDGVISRQVLFVDVTGTGGREHRRQNADIGACIIARDDGRDTHEHDVAVTVAQGAGAVPQGQVSIKTKRWDAHIAGPPTDSVDDRILCMTSLTVQSPAVQEPRAGHPKDDRPTRV